MDLKKTLGPWLGKTTKMLSCIINDTLAENSIDLTREQWLILVMLNTKGSLSQKHLAMITERDKTSLTRLIHTMERKDLVIRKISETDKRVKKIFLTQTGKIVFETALPIMQTVILSLQKGLTQEEIENTIKILQKLQTNISTISNSCRNYKQKQ